MGKHTTRQTPLPIPIAQTMLHHWQVAVHAAIEVIMDAHPDLHRHEPLPPAEQLVVTAIHQLSLAEDAMSAALGQPIGYAPAHRIESEPRPT